MCLLFGDLFFFVYGYYVCFFCESFFDLIDLCQIYCGFCFVDELDDGWIVVVLCYLMQVFDFGGEVWEGLGFEYLVVWDWMYLYLYFGDDVEDFF